MAKRKHHDENHEETPAQVEEPVEASVEAEGDGAAVEAQAEGATAATEATEVERLQAEVERLQAEVERLQEQVLRRAAEFQNYRRRTEQDLANAAARGREDAVLAVLDVYDDLRRALAAAEQAASQEGASPGPAYDALHEGVELVYKKFSDVLTRLGVEPIAAVGRPFDETLHDALMQQPAPDPETPSGTVLAEIQPGYRLGDRVLRHAQVVVAQ